MQTTMDPRLRDEAVHALTFHALSRGQGTLRQQQAWQELEWRKCTADPVYFLDTYGWLVLKDGSVVRWNLWPVQELLLREWVQRRSTVAVKARQLGVTTLSAHFALWDCLFHDAARWTLLSASEDKAKDIITRVQATKDRLPEWMIERAQRRNMANRDVVKRADKSDAMSRIAFGLSEMKIMTSTSKSIKGAAGNFVIDEFTEHTEQKRKLHMLFGLLDSGAMAIVIANGEGEDQFYHLYQRAKKGDNAFTPYFFWWGDDPTRLNGATVDGVDATTLSREAVIKAAEEGKLSSPWYDYKQRQYLLDSPEADEYAFRQQFPTTESEAFYLTGNSRFSLKIVNGYLETARERGERERPVRGEVVAEAGGYHLDERGNGPVWVYEQPIAGFEYVIGADSSGGSSAGDYAVAQVVKVLGNRLSEQVAVLRAKMEPTEFAHHLAALGHWYNDAFLVPEANNTGLVVVDRLKADYFNLYMRKAAVAKFSTHDADQIGFWTDRGSKPKLVAQLAEHLNQHWLDLSDIATIAELSHYQIDPDGVGTSAPKGMNDDCVMALALAVEGVADRESFASRAEIRSLMPWED